MVETLSSLSDLSKKLNAKSNDLNKLIVSVNARLKEMNFGTEVWLIDEPVEAGDPNDIDGTDPWRDVTLLGYCEVEDEWQLAAKQGTLVDKISFHGGGSYQEVRNSEKPVPLLKTPRAIRLRATRLIPDLLDEIKSEAERLLKAINDAEAQAAKL